MRDGKRARGNAIPKQRARRSFYRDTFSLYLSPSLFGENCGDVGLVNGGICNESKIVDKSGIQS